MLIIRSFLNLVPPLLFVLCTRSSSTPTPRHPSPPSTSPTTPATLANSFGDLATATNSSQRLPKYLPTLKFFTNLIHLGGHIIPFKPASVEIGLKLLLAPKSLGFSSLIVELECEEELRVHERGRMEKVVDGGGGEGRGGLASKVEGGGGGGGAGSDGDEGGLELAEANS